MPRTKVAHSAFGSKAKKMRCGESSKQGRNEKHHEGPRELRWEKAEW